MRLFVALDLPEPVKNSLASLIETLRPCAALRWVKPENLHITTKFIGEFPEEDLDLLQAALSEIQSPAVPISVRGLGWFPNPHRPRVFWAAVHAPDSLPALARATEEAVVGLGVPREGRPWAPHLTLARIEATVDLASLRRRIASLDGQDWGSFKATEFHLYKSDLRPGGSVYTRLVTFPLAVTPADSKGANQGGL
ncbi:MAG: RNA 2',3'-cyclic phosphodiesterase [Bryobacteraceae bacterium]|nr:RNA 2',3'-cyclic phosphodiesterase [Bryobacteraceae bacterium]MDW8378243.1 RNA 2',3'-cyclic phosphodiesterase [Bryobacterales bacterium]